MTVDITDLNIKYKMTWNKVAKAIHRWVHENAQPPVVTGRKKAMIKPEFTIAADGKQLDKNTHFEED